MFATFKSCRRARSGGLTWLHLLRCFVALSPSLHLSISPLSSPRPETRFRPCGAGRIFWWLALACMVLECLFVASLRPPLSCVNDRSFLLKQITNKDAIARKDYKKSCRAAYFIALMNSAGGGPSATIRSGAMSESASLPPRIMSTRAADSRII
jgi:hypothetical protein